jgi:17beta-estradiol 17-dehydrogenase/3beta-hydroxysteroid 3-dehydrogenase
MRYININTISYRYKRLDFLFCNAGLLSASGIKWGQVITLFLKNPVNFIESSDATQQIMGEINDDQVGLVFACNVLGHYIMIRELEVLLMASGGGRVIWTSSSTASSATFSIDDWQGIQA